MLHYNDLLGLDGFNMMELLLFHPPPPPKIHLKDAGFCPVTSCPSGVTQIREAWATDPTAPDTVLATNNGGVWATVSLPPPYGSSFEMFTRDRRQDKYISGAIQSGKVFDKSVRDVLLTSLATRRDDHPRTRVFIAVGTNIGYFSSIALSLGARVISFEPFRGNAGTFMNTVRKNAWNNRSTLYMNPVSYESLRVKMESTDERSNLSNMYIASAGCLNMTTSTTTSTGSTPAENIHGTYGVDYMDAVSLDQVMLEHHPEMDHVDLMKVDVETHEIQVINGAMYFLCNRRVDRIIMEIEYLKAKHKLTKCNFSAMQEKLTRMRYSIYDPAMKTDYTNSSVDSMSTADALFVLQFPAQEGTPATRLRGSENNPCQEFDLGPIKSHRT